MPTRCIHSRSFVIPSRVTLPFVQCHHVLGLAESGGFLNPCSNVPADCARTTPAKANIAAANAIALHLFFIVPRCTQYVTAWRCTRRPARENAAGDWWATAQASDASS